MSQLPLITNVDQLEEWIQLSDQHSVLLFKHSTQCSVSADALEELTKYFQEEAKDIKVGLIHVIENRPVSNEIADRFGIKHESPQALWIKDRKVVWHASHWHITQEALKNANPDHV
mgnify:CR=1 FL=1